MTSDRGHGAFRVSGLVCRDAVLRRRHLAAITGDQGTADDLLRVAEAIGLTLEVGSVVLLPSGAGVVAMLPQLAGAPPPCASVRLDSAGESPAAIGDLLARHARNGGLVGDVGIVAHIGRSAMADILPS